MILFHEKGKKNCRKIDLLIINHTDSVTSFFEDWNSWGYFNAGFIISTKGKTYSLYKKMRRWPKNFPSYKTLFPGDTLRLNFVLNAQNFICKDHSDFDGTIPIGDSSATIRAFYKLHPETLEQANYAIEGTMIKYKEIFREDKQGFGKLIKVDSLKSPVEAKKTFVLERLESEDYKLN